MFASKNDAKRNSIAPATDGRHIHARAFKLPAPNLYVDVNIARSKRRDVSDLAAICVVVQWETYGTRMVNKTTLGRRSFGWFCVI